MMRRSGGSGRPSRPTKKGDQDLELVSFGKYTFNLPRVLPPTASPNDKYAVLQATVQTVQRSATTDDARIGALVARFGEAVPSTDPRVVVTVCDLQRRP